MFRVECHGIRKLKKQHAVPNGLMNQRTKKVVQANNPERLGIAWLRSGNNDLSCRLLLEDGLEVVRSYFVKGDIQRSAVGDCYRTHATKVLCGLDIGCLDSVWLKRIVVDESYYSADRDVDCRRVGGDGQVIVEGNYDYRLGGWSWCRR